MKKPSIKTGSVAELAQTIWIHTPSLAVEVNEGPKGQTKYEMTAWLNAISDAQQALTFALAQPRNAARRAELERAVAYLVKTHNEVRAARWERETAIEKAAQVEAAHAACIEYRIAAANAESMRDLYHRPGSWVTDECMATVTARYEAAVEAINALPNRPGTP